jgi:hypothetical protein
MAIFRTMALALTFACATALSAAAPDENASTPDGSQYIDHSIKPGDDFYGYAKRGHS